MENLQSLVDVNTIIGNPITTAGGIDILPISKVSFGYGSGGSDITSSKDARFFGGGTGGGVTLEPLGFLVINNGDVKLLQMQTADSTGDRIVNAVPGLIEKLGDMFKKSKKTKEEEEPKEEKAD